MNKQFYILFLLCAVLSSCGMTDVWTEWENEGKMSEDRLRPSEVKTLLCGADGWKMDYEGTAFYFRFTEGGSITSDTDESMLQNEVETSYYLDYEGEKKVLLTVQGKGMLQYLANNAEETFVITSYSSTQITASGLENGQAMVLTPVTTADMQQVKEAKRKAVIAYNKAQSLELLKTSLSNGLIRDNASNSVIAHYSISCDESNRWTMRLSSFEGKTLLHKDYAMTVDTSNDEKATLTIAGSPTVGNVTIAALYYGYDNGELSISNANLKLDLTKSSAFVSQYTGSWKTHTLDRDYICDEFTGFITQIEFDDRSPRNVVICPAATEAGQWFYVFFTVVANSNDATGRVYLTNSDAKLLYGGYGNDIELARDCFNDFLNFCFSEEGLWIYEDADSYVYVLSPTSGTWFRMK